jgi:hypothetical protein
MRRAPLLLLLLAVVPVAGCGGHARAAAPAPVRVTIEAPGDEMVTRSDVLTVRGSVTPADAAVQVLGRSADVVAGSFTARVPLAPGANVIDLEATADGRDPALTALRVTREMPITVPDLTHLTVAAARAKLGSLGLRLRTTDDGGLLEPILPGTPGVCEQRPDAGSELHRGDTVVAGVAKRC